MIAYYSVASTSDAVFVIGGRNRKLFPKDEIFKFDDNGWSLYGNLHALRFSFGSITSGSLTMVIGGESFDDSYKIS